MRETCNDRKLFDDIVNNLERMKRNIDCNNQLIEGDLERRNGLSEGIGLAIDIVKETARLNKII